MSNLSDEQKSDSCPHGYSKGYCGDPACIPFNAGLGRQSDDESLHEHEQEQLRYGKLPPL